MRALPLLLSATLLAVTAHRTVPSSAWLDWRVLALVGVLPWLALAATWSPRKAAAALRDGLAGAERRSAEECAHSTAILHSAGHHALAAGGLTALLMVAGALRSFALEQQPPSVAVLAVTAVSMALGPLYGMALRAFVYEPLAQRLAADRR